MAGTSRCSITAITAPTMDACWSACRCRRATSRCSRRSLPGSAIRIRMKPATPRTGCSSAKISVTNLSSRPMLRHLVPFLATLLLTAVAHAASQDDDFLAAREAFRVGDAVRFERAAKSLGGYVLEPYVDYWRIKPIA